ncbi:hypothetical protein [Pseudogracilibacillus sp. SO30301A]|uniref:hypothetical protein n=1 Tax=Pseudogracilibacillus sp. SO30301A TaxID=3098291 RepID=UPI00300E0787
MESFFDFIAEYFFLVIIIVAVIINFLSKGRREENKQEQTPKKTQRRRPTMADMRETYEQAKEMVFDTKKEIENSTQTVEKSIEQQRHEQYERLRNRYKPTTLTDSKDHNEKIYSGSESRPLNVERQESEAINVNLDKKLTSKGLIESVIMAEVLGPPRALRPYQNIITKRKQR